MEQDKILHGSRKRAYEKISWHNECETSVQRDIEKLFNKKFSFQKPEGDKWVLPDAPDAPSGEPKLSDKLEKLKVSLNRVKDQLSDKDLEKWHPHTRSTNWAGKIISRVRQSTNAELCTQAWCKFYEVLGTFPVLPEAALQAGKLNSVHLCEAPGAFITSLNHYLRSNYASCDWKWVANTLNPYHEGNDMGTMIADDRLIVGTLSRWYFGPDDTGNVMDRRHLEGLIEFTRDQGMETIHLVTADGSVDCQDDPGEQEARVAPLHYCEAVTALRLLSPGGSLVLKMFTLFERPSACLIYLLNCCFEQVHVFKPATSKAGNSEVYIVCLEYRGRSVLGSHLEELERGFGPGLPRDSALARSALPPTFLRQLEDCCSVFHQHQTTTIRENLRLFAGSTPREAERLAQRRNCAADHYLRHFRLSNLSRRHWVLKDYLPDLGLMGQFNSQSKRQQAGSHNQMRELAQQGWRERLCQGPLGRKVAAHCGGLSTLAPPLLEGQAEAPGCHLWRVLEARALSSLASSPFCEAEFLHSLNESLEAADAGSALVPCSSCHPLSPEQVLTQLTKVAKPLGVSVDRLLVLGALELLDLGGLSTSHPSLSVPLPPSTRLHDGDPRYQRWLLEAVLKVLTESSEGTAFILPLRSAFTRFTAGLVLVLSHCFRSLSFAWPFSDSGPICPVVLLGVGFRQPPAELLEFLRQLSGRLAELQWPAGAEPGQQVLQFVPTEMLLSGCLPKFLSALNIATCRYRLHLAVQEAET
ncbi:cap-specific mRNA (nucleoside-2'-O-)-methyltransferase 2 [Hypanus sabinus]|uniref:cap-specific mRNA (nucleoside-2'-O-)-methyltransferase 2 n=1 Tax=Hypanus sabinus TaxID=79690 RepID=UPI0028C420BF|nr:cap-specific mRNA (nucleoside-2'-O-)-methyltransferase 2 [Hypanus sabinus]